MIHQMTFKIHQQYKLELKKISIFLAILLLTMLASWIFPPILKTNTNSYYLPFHIFAETISIIISIMVFAFCWGIDIKERPNNFLFLSSIFFGVALLDFLHTISFKGMPRFITPSGAEKAINFWLSARLLSSVGLLIVSIRPWKKRQSEVNRWKILLIILAIVAIDTWIVLYHPDWIPHTYIEGKGLTDFKKIFEYFIIALNLLTAFLFLKSMNEKRNYDVTGLFTCCIVLAISEFFFTIYINVTDFYNLVGHIYKCIAYAFVYRSVFLDSIRIIIDRLNQNERLLSTILETLPVAVFVKDLQKGFQFKIWNKFAEKIYSMKAEEIIGKTDYDFFSKAEADWFRKKDAEAIQKHEVIDIPEEYIHTKHGLVTVHTKKTTVKDESGNPLFLLGVSEDISAIKEITSNLENAIQSRDEFLIIASHELKTPITTLKLRLQIMQRHYASNEQIMADTKILLKQVDRLIRLMNSILDVSRIQSGKFSLNIAPMNLNDTITGIIDQLNEQLVSAHCEIHFELKSTMIRNWDQARIEQIFINLISNSIKYAPGSKISIGVSADSRTTTIEYKDYGPGIPKEKQSLVFERFERAGAPLSISGLGLGLFICKKIVEALNGTIRLESEAGKGTKFIIELPNEAGFPLLPMPFGLESTGTQIHH